MGGPMVARHDAMVRHDGTVHQILGGYTTADSDSAMVRDHPDLWRPIRIDFPATAGDSVAAAGGPSPAAAPKRPRARKES